MILNVVAWGLNDQGCFPDALETPESASMGRLARAYRRLMCRSAESTETKQDSVSQLIKKELVQVHMDVDEERSVLLGDDAATMTRREQSKHLLYLFQRDLLPGLQGQILDSKAHRGAVERKQKAVSFRMKVVAWICIAVIDISTLTYIFLFAISQTGPKQRAWAKSFAVWMLVDVLLVSSLVAVCMHVFLPMLIMTDVRQIQLKLAVSIKQFYKDINTSKTSVDSELVAMKRTAFNAASYLFVSHRVASLLYDDSAPAPSSSGPSTSTSTVAKMILRFRTLWPKQSYQHTTDLSANYVSKNAAIYRSISFVAVYFLSNFLAVPLAIQDMVLQMASTAAMGYTVQLHLQLYAIYPVLVVVPLLLLGTIVHFVVQSIRGQDVLSRRKLMYELRGDDPSSEESEAVETTGIKTLSRSSSASSSFSGSEEEAAHKPDNVAIDFSDDWSDDDAEDERSDAIHDARYHPRSAAKDTLTESKVLSKAASQSRGVERVDAIPSQQPHVSRRQSTQQALHIMHRLVKAADLAEAGSVVCPTLSSQDSHGPLRRVMESFEEDRKDDTEDVWLHNLHLSPSLSTTSSFSAQLRQLMSDDEEVSSLSDNWLSAITSGSATESEA